MGDSAPKDRRRYAHPGEFEIPDSVLETSSFRQRLGGELNSDRKAPAAPSRDLHPSADLRVSGDLDSDRKGPAAPSRDLRSSGNLRASGELRPSGELSPLRAKPTPLAVEAHLNGDPSQYRGNPIPVSREPRPSVDLSSIRTAPSPIKVDARLSTGLNQSPRNPVPVSRESRLSSELNPVRRNPVPLAAEGRLRADLNQHLRAAAPPTGKDAIVRRRVAARFELLPEPKSRWNRIGWSAAVQLGFLGLLLLSPVIFPHEMQTALKLDVVPLAQPITYVEPPSPTPPPPPPPKIKPKAPPPELKPKVPKPKPIEVVPPVLNPRQPHVFLVLKPELRKARIVEVKPVEITQVVQPMEIVLRSSRPKRPLEEIQAPNLGLGALPASVVAATDKVQTGGFGDPRGIPGPANPSKAANINKAGSPGLPGGPGYGNGTGGAQGARGTLASADGPKSSGVATGAASRGVDILSEPNPAYSTEARSLRVEGDVLLEVVFLASSQVQVVRVVSGLGHGLDEAAMQAAKQIRFRPATREGKPIDFPARVRISFRLAS